MRFSIQGWTNLPQSRSGIHNPGHNILEFYNNVVQIRFTTSKIKLDTQCSKLSIRVASRVAERLKNQNLRKLGNVRKISNLGGHIGQCLVSLQELRLSSQETRKNRYQTFLFLSSFTGLLHFVPNLLSGIALATNILFLTRSSPLPTTTF